MARLLIWLGIALVGMGVLTIGAGLLAAALGARGGRLLPGDIVISRPGITIVFPIATSIVLSLLLTLVLWIALAWRR
jgi:hypothetical protein